MPLRRAARVVIGRSGLEITLAEGGSIRWPLAEVRQTQGFYAGEEVRLEHGSELSEALLVRDLGFLSALRAAAPEAAAAFHDPGRRRYRVGLTVLAALGAVGLAIALYVWGIPALASVLATRVPVSWEVALGDAVVAELAPPGRRCVDPRAPGPHRHDHGDAREDAARGALSDPGDRGEPPDRQCAGHAGRVDRRLPRAPRSDGERRGARPGCWPTRSSTSCTVTRPRRSCVRRPPVSSSPRSSGT